MRRAILVLMLAGCGGGAVSSDEEAELAYVGLDRAVSRALELGLRGFSEAQGANIPEQEEGGEVSGTMTVAGQVDQGASDNKGLRLVVDLTDYADVEDLDDDDDRDEIVVTYATDAPAVLDLQLRDMPDGTLGGTFVGTFVMSGDLEGPITLDLEVSGPTEAGPPSPDGVQRVEGETAITGTAVNDHDGEYEVDITL